MSYKVLWCTDYHDCEDCGESSATGFLVYKDDILVLDKSPIAHCFNSVDFMNPYKEILDLENIEFEEIEQ